MILGSLKRYVILAITLRGFWQPRKCWLKWRKMPILALQSCLILLTWKFNQETWRCLSKSPLTIGSTTKWLWREYQEWTLLEETRHFRCTKSVVHAYSYRNAKSRAALHCSGIKNVGGVLYCIIPLKDIVISHIPDKYSKEMSKKSTKVSLALTFKNVNEEMLAILKQFHTYLTESADGSCDPQLLTGDQLSIERAVNVIASVSNGYTAEDRL